MHYKITNFHLYKHKAIISKQKIRNKDKWLSFILAYILSMFTYSCYKIKQEETTHLILQHLILQRKNENNSCFFSISHSL